MTKQISFKDTEKHFESIMNFDDLKDLTTKEIKQVAVLMESVRLEEQSKFNSVRKTCENNSSRKRGLTHKTTESSDRPYLYEERVFVRAIPFERRKNLENIRSFLGHYVGDRISMYENSDGSFFEITMRAVMTPNLRGEIGDYIVKDECNHYKVVKREEFKRRFLEVE